MDKNELRMHLQKCEKLHERRKFKRMIAVILLYAAVDFWIISGQVQLDTGNIWHILAGIVGSIIVGGITFFFNALIWIPLCNKSEEENRALEFLRKRLREKEDN